MSFLYQIAASLGKPFIESYENTSIIYNEILVCAYLYTLLGLSMCPVSEKEVRANLGWTLLAIIFISTGGNLLKTIILIVREAIHLKRKRDARLRYEEKEKKYAESVNSPKAKETTCQPMSPDNLLSEEPAVRHITRDE